MANFTMTWYDNTTQREAFADNRTENGTFSDTGSTLSAMDYVSYVFLPVTVCIGVAGNILTIIVMRSPKFWGSTSSLLLISLALSDTTLLLAQPFNKSFFIRLIGRDVRALSDVGCKLYFIVRRSSKMVSSWFVVGLCVERFIAVWFPLNAKRMFTKRTASIYICVVCIVILAFTGGWSYASKIKDDGKCHPDVYNRKDQQSTNVFGGMLRAGSTLYSVAPMIILVILTPMIIAKIAVHSKARKNMTGSSGNSKEQVKVTAMLVGIVAAYIVLVLPITVLHNAAYELKISAFGSDKEGFTLFKEIAQILEQLNYSMNFFLYVVTSRMFRGVLKDMACKKCLSAQCSLRQSVQTRQTNCSEKSKQADKFNAI